MSETKAAVETPKKKRNVLVDLLLIMLAVAIVLAVVGFVQKDNLAVQLKDVQADLETAMTKAEATATELTTAQTDLAGLKTELETAQASAGQVPDLQAKIDELTAQVGGMVPQADVDTLNEQLATAQTDLTTAQTNAEKLQADLKTAQDAAARIPDLEAQIATLAESANIDVDALVGEATNAEHKALAESFGKVQEALNALKGDALGAIKAVDLEPIKTELKTLLDDLQAKIDAFTTK